MNQISSSTAVAVTQKFVSRAKPPLLPRAKPVATFADLMAHSEYWFGLPHTVRDPHQSYIRTAGYIALSSRARAGGRTDRVRRANVVLSAVPVDVEWLNQHLFTFPAAVHGLTEISYAKSISGLRRILRYFDLIDPRTQSPPPAESAWAQLLKNYEDRPYVGMSLNSFAAWCHINGVAPEDVTQQTLTAFETYMRTRHLNSNVAGVLRGVRKTWRQVVQSLPKGPRDPAFASKSPKRYTLPIEAFPQTYQDDVAVFVGRLAGANRRGPFRGDGPKRKLQARSIEMRVYSLRQAASALVIMGRDPESIRSLADLVEEQAFESILTFFWKRAVAARMTAEDHACGVEPAAELGVTAQTGMIASALMMVATHHCKLSAAKLKPLREMASDLKPRAQSELNQKVRDRLRQFDDPVTRAKLLHLPQLLMELAAADTAQPKRAARMARTAVAIELLLHIPMRISNLVALRLGRHLKLGDTRRGRITHIVLQAGETKSHADPEWWVSPDLAAFIDHYLQRYRPSLANPGSDYLFPAGFQEQGPLSNCCMSVNLNQIIAEKVGAITNPHLFRSLCARLILEHSPGALEDVRLMLGNKTLEVIVAHYNPVERRMAGRRADDVLRRARGETAHLAQPIAPRRKGCSK